MENHSHTCIYCHSARLSVGENAQGLSFIVCDECGARGPTASDHRAAWQKLGSENGDNLLRTVIDESPDIILLKDWDGNFLMCNRALARLYGSEPHMMVGKTDADYNPDVEQVAFYKENIQSIMREGKLRIVEEASTDSRTGETHYFQSIKKPLKGPDGQDRFW